LELRQAHWQLCDRFSEPFFRDQGYLDRPRATWLEVLDGQSRESQIVGMISAAKARQRIWKN
jgi:hypothetical protein